MRTTLSLDPDVAAQVEAERERTHSPLKQIINEALRRGLNQPRETASAEPRTRPVHLGLRSLPKIDDVSEAITQAEGDDHR